MKRSHTPCFVIPNYDHGEGFDVIVQRLTEFGLPIIVVNDGSTREVTELLESLDEKHASVQVLHADRNYGKGHAVITGLRRASELGCTHALQLDADGQHDLGDVERFLETSRQQPDAVITGQPIYDDSVPLSRICFRYLTHVLVWIETLSLQIRDSMCGFRVYPLEQTIRLFDRVRLGNRMDFDIEVLVRLYWEGVPPVSIPTRVTYPVGNTSNFRLFSDNVLITRMHCLLIFGMLIRLPKLLARKWSNRRSKHWSAIAEKGSFLSLTLLFRIYTIFGRWLFLLVLHPVVFYYTFVAGEARDASRQYLLQIDGFTGGEAFQGRVTWKTVYAHFYNFGVSAIDKIAAWSGHIKRQDAVVHGNELFGEIADSGRGALFIGSHLGNLELCRALGREDGRLTVNAVVFNKNALKFQSVLRKSNAEAELNLIHVEEIGVETAVLLRQKVEDGEVVIIVGDRTSVSSVGRVQYADFLGRKAAFSEGPFILAGLLNCPVYLIFCLRMADRYHVTLERFADSMKFPRSHRATMLREKIQAYADRLAHYCTKAPLQWFNFYDFWRDDNTLVRQNATAASKDAR